MSGVFRASSAVAFSGATADESGHQTQQVPHRGSAGGSFEKTFRFLEAEQ